VSIVPEILKQLGLFEMLRGYSAATNPANGGCFLFFCEKAAAPYLWGWLSGQCGCIFLKSNLLKPIHVCHPQLRLAVRDSI
jgi:hypothetical protein